MLKLIRADLFRLFHRAYFYVLLGGLAGLAVLINFAITHGGEYAVTSFSWGLLVSYLSIPLMLLPMLADVVFAEEYKEHTLKNTVAHGVNRVELYLSKTVTAVLLGLLLAVVAVGAYCASSLVLLRRDPQFTEQFVREFFLRVGAACTVYIAGLMLSDLLAVLFKRNSVFVFAYYGVIFLPKILCQALQMSQLSKCLLITQISAISNGSMQDVRTAAIIGAVSAAVFVILGPVLFLKQDVE